MHKYAQNVKHTSPPIIWYTHGIIILNLQQQHREHPRHDHIDPPQVAAQLRDGWSCFALQDVLMTNLGSDQKYTTTTVLSWFVGFSSWIFLQPPIRWTFWESSPNRVENKNMLVKLLPKGFYFQDFLQLFSDLDLRHDQSK